MQNIIGNRIFFKDYDFIMLILKNRESVAVRLNWERWARSEIKQNDYILSIFFFNSENLSSKTPISDPFLLLPKNGFSSSSERYLQSTTNLFLSSRKIYYTTVEMTIVK